MREALETPWLNHCEVQGLSKSERREVEKHLDKVMKENKEEIMYAPHMAKTEKRTKILGRTLLYVSCRTAFPYGMVIVY